MGIQENKISFTGQEVAYFNWSNSETPPPLWEFVEKPALTEGIAFALQTLKENDPGRVIKSLDIGVGGGKVLGLLKELGVEDNDLIGTDLNSKLLELVGNKYPDITLRHADLSSVNHNKNLSDKEPFDIITCSMVLNHLDDVQVEQAVQNIAQLLGHDGFFVGLVPYPRRFNEPYKQTKTSVGTFTEENTPWGGQVTYYYRSFNQYFDLFDAIGGMVAVYTKTYMKSYLDPSDLVLEKMKEYPKRELIVARKWPINHPKI